MSAAQRFEVGDAVATVKHIGRDLQKRRLGDVIDLGAQGARVRFVDGETLWIPSGKLWHLRDDGPGGTVLTKERPPADQSYAKAPAATPERPKLHAVAAPVAEPPPPPPPHMPSVAEMFEAQGIDPIAAWKAFGEELVTRARRAVEEADIAREAAEDEVTAAESMLEEAKRGVATATKRAADARASLAEITRRLGVTP